MKNKTTNSKVKSYNLLGNFRISLIFVLIIGAIHAQSYTYTGASGGNWNVASNWSGGVIPYIDDTSCSVSIPGGRIVNIPAGVNLLMESGTVGGAGTIENNGTFTAETTGDKNFSIELFENKGTFNLGTGTDNGGYISMYNVTEFENASSGELIANGLKFSFAGGNNIHNFGVIKKIGDFSTTFDNINVENEGEINVEEGTLILNGTKKLKTGAFNVAEDATLEISGNNALSGIWTGTVDGTFKLNGYNTVVASTTADNQISGKGITFTTGTYAGVGTFINSTVFTADTTGSKNITIVLFQNKGTFNLGTGTDDGGYISMYNGTEFENASSGELIANGLKFSFAGGNNIHNFGVIKKIGDFSTTFDNINVENEGEINVEEGTLILNGTKKLKTGAFNVAEDATLEISGNNALSGIWTGTVDGTFKLNGYNTVVASTTADNQISGKGITFTTGTYAGVGTFINSTVFTADTTGSKNITIVLFQNKGTFNLGTGSSSGGSISMYNGTFYENASTGETILNGLRFSYSGGSSIENFGIIRKLGNYDETFEIDLDNKGNIIAEEGKITFSRILNNTATGIISGYSIGTPSGTNFTNAGTIAPGMSPGILNVSGQMKITDGILEVDLDGMTVGIQYDRLNYTGTTPVNLSGNIVINLGFHPTINSEFVIFTSPSAAITSTLSSPIFVEYEGYHYYFVVSNESNQIKLKVTQRTLAANETALVKANIYPNPVIDNLNYSLTSLPQKYSVFSLDGRLLLSGELKEKNGSINLSKISKGNYILIINTEIGILRKKIIKK